MTTVIIDTCPADLKNSEKDAKLGPLEKLLGKDKAKKLMADFHRTANGLSCTFYDTPYTLPRIVYNGQKASPIVIGTLKDISFYDVTGIPRDPPKTSQDKMSYLNKYLLIPSKSGKLVFVSDDHNHAAFAWLLAQQSGIINNATLIHIDNHFDYFHDIEFHFDTSASSILKDSARFVRESLEYFSFIPFGTTCKTPSGHIIDPDGVYFVITDNINKGILEPFSHWANGRPIGFNTSLELADKVVEKAKNDNKSIVCDIDLDFFLPYFIQSRNFASISGMTFEEALRKVIDIARNADFISIATSPNYMAIPDHKEKVRYLLNRIIKELNRTS